ncbi:Prophage PssSM-02, Orf18 [Pseudomonas syringae]|nr:Prophage PssSM-02, Orf18 [Pseudomonas syringae]
MMTRKQRQRRIYTWRGFFVVLALVTAWMLASAYASHITQ